MKSSRNGRTLVLTQLPTADDITPPESVDIEVSLDYDILNTARSINLAEKVLDELVLPEIDRLINLRPKYICTHVEKDTEADHPEYGLGGYDSGSETDNGNANPFSEDVRVTANSLPALLTKLGKKYDLKIDEVTFDPEEEVETPDDITEIRFHRQEDANGDVPNKVQTNAWKAGEETQFYATYRFTIKRVMVFPMTRDEIAQMVKVDE